MKKTKESAKTKEIKTLEPALYVVASPIGNPEDWTVRAQKILSQCDIIAAEDTRVTKSALSKIGVNPKKIVSYHDHNEEESAKGLLASLKKNQSVALVSDAGTPLISDPGYRIISAAIKEGIRVTPVPGASSLMASLSISPMGGSTVFFGGFLPTQAKSRQELLTKCRSVADQLVFFEAPHRIKETMDDIENIFGSTQEMMVARELTKSFEEILVKSSGEMKKHFSVHEPRGEFVILIKGLLEPKLSRDFTKAKVKELFEQGLSASDIVEKLQPVSELPRKEIYDMVLSVKKV